MSSSDVPSFCQKLEFSRAVNRCCTNERVFILHTVRASDKNLKRQTLGKLSVIFQIRVSNDVAIDARVLEHVHKYGRDTRCTSRWFSFETRHGSSARPIIG